MQLPCNDIKLQLPSLNTSFAIYEVLQVDAEIEVKAWRHLKHYITISGNSLKPNGANHARNQTYSITQHAAKVPTKH